VEPQAVSENQNNVGRAFECRVWLTHTDTVPPFIAPTEDGCEDARVSEWRYTGLECYALLRARVSAFCVL
jgi:hypothetical protein